jgi:hypothetical protein
MQDLGRMLIVLGAFILTAGCLLVLASQLGMPLGRLPGDVAIRGRNFSFYAPLATCALLSVVLSLLVWLIRYFRR